MRKPISNWPTGIALLFILFFFLSVPGSVESFEESDIEAIIVDLRLTFTDTGSGMGHGARMRFSNNGIHWSPDEPYFPYKKDWDLVAYGGTNTDGLHTVYVQVCDAAQNWSGPIPAYVFTKDYCFYTKTICDKY